jgi:hypothetical protein
MTYDTLSEAISVLQKKGYTEDLNLQSDCLECKALDHRLYVDQFEIDEVHRFEGASNPDDSSILFAISAPEFNLKGLLVDAYGAYADPLNTEMIRKLAFRP